MVNDYDEDHTLVVLGAGLATLGGIHLIGLADERQAVEVVPPEVLLSNTGTILRWRLVFFFLRRFAANNAS